MSHHAGPAPVEGRQAKDRRLIYENQSAPAASSPLRLALRRKPRSSLREALEPLELALDDRGVVVHV